MTDEVETPSTSWRSILSRSGAREATEQEWRDFLAEHGPHMLPPDDEGIRPDRARQSGATLFAQANRD